MCMSCGCGEANADHGNKDHITMEDIEKAAKAAGTTPEEVVQNIQHTVQEQKKSKQ
ncbi:hypothetical protein KSU1_C0362 [Candidatus Jettenia caeni]|uniref:Uncharacterized protein n=1 Tax=Candidatus Jettenia caeni TaxID=247490 RepID=I3IJR3_9BACT|nr:hypothetical protein [Candidatus Jettenia sp. AMX1]NUN22966.1 hypothetical protein [Candidatus Jettenia caeni]UJS16777.1 MAG: hypothetical protein L3J17_12795 [Candidatus Jettenia sp.]WKZ17225.1 MAG: hypothetical protein QY317_07880 [Candidatus Jettenia caeni]GAB61958.1 hypothetical protein KSU1_C0362 [Candidatus Jettenia caeni]GIL21297.1 MAG: hypothetical protein BroJett041_24110 [Candidatus Jettenia caeni]